jgi:hypothetical protein
VSSSEEFSTRRHLFNSFIGIAIIASILLIIVEPPISRLETFRKMNSLEGEYSIAVVFFVLLFSIEFLIRVIASGFLFTPKAYLKSYWNGLDFLVLATYYIGFFVDVNDSSGIGRALRTTQALRPLRLISHHRRLKQIFIDALVSGLSTFADTFILLLFSIVPFAVYATNIFSGLFDRCTDIQRSKAECVGEFVDKDGIMRPRVWIPPDGGYTFYTFWNSLLVLAEISSTEGWVTILEDAMKITTIGEAPGDPSNLQQSWNALFLCIYIFVGAFLIVNVFVAVIVKNFSSRDGTALLTTDQRRWEDLKRRIKNLRPSRKPFPRTALQKFCFKHIGNKHTTFSYVVNGVIILNVLLLAIDHHSIIRGYRRVLSFVFAVFGLLYLLEILMKMIGLGFFVVSFT